MQQAIGSACGELDLQSFGTGNEKSCLQSEDVLARTAGTLLFFRRLMCCAIPEGRMASGLEESNGSSLQTARTYPKL